MPTEIVEISSEEKAERLKDFTDTYVWNQGCVYALALHAGLGWPIVGLFENDNPLNPLHAGVQSPNGHILDARGELPKKEFMDPFVGTKPCALLSVEAGNLMRVLRDGVNPEQIKHEIGVALLLAQEKSPHLPWKNFKR